MTQKKEYICKVVSKEFLTPDTAYIGIDCPEAASSAVPGQFVNISCSKFLKRPFGVASVSEDGRVLYVGIKVVGKGRALRDRTRHRDLDARFFGQRF